MAHKSAIEIINKMKLRNKKYYDRNTNLIDIFVGDKVKMVKEPYNKFANIYDGPFEVLEIDGQNVVIRLENNKKYKVHKDRLKKY